MSGFGPAFDESLFCGHAAYVVIEDELGRDEGSRSRDGAAARFVDGDEEGATVFFVACHFHVLQESDELDETPAKLATVGLDQDQLEDVNHQEATLLLAANINDKIVRN